MDKLPLCEAYVLALTLGALVVGWVFCGILLNVDRWVKARAISVELDNKMTQAELERETKSVGFGRG